MAWSSVCCLLALALVAGGLSTTSAGSAPAEPEAIEYTLAPRFEGDSLAALEFVLRFRGDDDGTTGLVLPDAWGGLTALYDGIRDLRVAGPGAALAPGTSAAERVIQHAPGAPLVVRYHILGSSPADPVAIDGNDYRPVLRPGYFHLLGETAFIRLEREATTPVRFAAPTLPPGWSFASDLEHGSAQAALTMETIGQSILVGGDFRILGRGMLRVAIRGDWGFGDEAFIDELVPIIESHAQAFHEPAPRYLVTVLPLRGEEGQTSIGGTGLGDAFAFFATTNVEPGQLRRMLAHEHLHTWIPGRLGRMPERDEAKDYWFSEGFTDFYTFRLLVRAGIWGTEEFAREFGAVLREYSTSAVREVPNSRIVEEFWTRPEVRKLPYQRGFLLAWRWDDVLRRTSGGRMDLDDVILAMKAAADSVAPTALPLREHFVERMRLAGVDVRGDLERFVDRGEPILLPANACAPCGTIATRELPVFDRGFDLERTARNGNRVTGLDPASPAARAGLAEGMELVRREAGKTGDSRVPVTYRVRDGQGERLITYRPEGERRFTLQEFEPAEAPDEESRLACARRLGGDDGSGQDRR